MSGGKCPGGNVLEPCAVWRLDFIKGGSNEKKSKYM